MVLDLVNGSFDDVVWCQVVVAPHWHSGGFHRYPHVDQVLGQSHRVWVPGNGDGSVRRVRLPLLRVGNPNHGAADLPDFEYLGSSLADYAADEIIGYSHFLRLRRGLSGGRLRGAGGAGRPQLTSGESRQSPLTCRVQGAGGG